MGGNWEIIDRCTAVAGDGDFLGNRRLGQGSEWKEDDSIKYVQQACTTVSVISHQWSLGQDFQNFQKF